MELVALPVDVVVAQSLSGPGLPVEDALTRTFWELYGMSPNGRTLLVIAHLTIEHDFHPSLFGDEETVISRLSLRSLCCVGNWAESEGAADRTDPSNFQEGYSLAEARH